MGSYPDSFARLGIEPGELPGSLRDAIMQVAPGMTMMPGATAPGETPQMMTDMMVANWKRKAERMPSIPPIDMRVEPTLVAPPVPRPEPSAPPPSLPAAVSLLTP